MPKSAIFQYCPIGGQQWETGVTGGRDNQSMAMTGSIGARIIPGRAIAAMIHAPTSRPSAKRPFWASIAISQGVMADT